LLRFKVSRNRFIVETNEDGFLRANVESICAVGESSKKATKDDDHIGEKGFGFKSVFAIANKVHIQSGIWSFSFTHNQGDNGLGMVTPMPELPNKLPQKVTTRITMELLDRSDLAFDKLVREVQNLPETSIFFLRNLKNLTIYTTKTKGKTTIKSINKGTEYFTSVHQIVTVSKTVRNRDGPELTPVSSDVTEYELVALNILKLPKDQRRKKTSAIVELAFPVGISDSKFQPDELGQHVFAYLPLHRIPHLQVRVH
jgi:hypothetical protein